MTQNDFDKLQQTIAALEAQRLVLGDTVVDDAIAALREKHTATKSTTAEQRKLVTVLFADLVGWTRMASIMDPEDVQAIQRAYFDAVTPTIKKHGGAVEKYIGDAVLAVFGVPQAHEDDPERAVRAALSMQEAVATLNSSLATTVSLTSDPPTLSLRIGIHTGLVLATLGQRQEDFVVTGDTVNLASRLEGAAPPGDVLISHATYRHVRGLFDVEPQKPLSVKGKVEPMQTYLVQGVRTRSFRDESRGVAGIETHMVGRDAEFLFLQNTLQDVMADGDLRMITVVAEAGVGKSRLLFELEQWAGELPEGIWYFKGRASPETEHQPYGLLRDMLAARFNIIESDTLAEVRDKLQEGIGSMKNGSALLIGQLLGYDFSDDPAVKPLIDDPRQLREQALAALASYFHQLAEQDLVMILLEDLHWADDSSLDTFNYLAQALAETHMVVLAASRPHLHQRRPHWGEGWAFHRRLDLRPLSKRAGRELVADILQRIEQVPKSLEDMIINGAEGNPFFVEELIKMLIDDRVIDLSDSENWQIDLEHLDQTQVPATLTGVLQARLDRLSAEERSVLQKASVVGPVFWDRVVAALRQTSDGENDEDEDLCAVNESLTILRSREFVYRRETSAFEDAIEHNFKHAVLRDVTYSSVLKRLRRNYHGLVADWLIEQTGERIGEYVGLIADHLQQAGRSDEAADYLILAGDQARTRGAYEEAVVRYERVVSLLEEQKRLDEAAHTYMKLGLSHHNAFEYRRARETYEKGFALLQQAGEIQRQAELPPAPHALRLGAAEPPSFDPAFTRDETSTSMTKQLFCGLVALGDELAVVPDIAQSWEIFEDGCRYVFHLREDVTWSDGVQVTAMDVEYTWKRMLHPATNSPNASLLYAIKHARKYHQGALTDATQLGVRAVDDFTLVVELEGPAGYFLQMMTDCVSYPLPRHVIETYGETWTDTDNIVSNGPFLLESWDRSLGMTFVRNPNYHGQIRGNVLRVDINISRDWSANLALYEADELESFDILEGESSLEMIDIARVWQRFAGDVVSATRMASMYIGMDQSKRPFDDPRVRKALALATDKDAVVDMVPHNFSLPATGGFIALGIPGHAPGIGLPYDPDQARWLLAQSGFPGGADFPAIDAFGHHSASHQFEFLQHHWRENLGISIGWTGLEWGAYYERFHHHQPQLRCVGWVADYPDPDNFLRVGLEDSIAGWHNVTFAKLVGEANRTTDQSRRIQLFQQADRILIQEAAIIPLVYLRWHILAKPWVIGLTGNQAFSRWQDVIIKPH